MSDRRSGLLLLGVTVSMALVLALSVFINTRLVAASEQRSCDGLLAQINVYIETPPPTATGKNLERAYRAQYAQYHCGPEPRPTRSAAPFPSRTGN